MEEQKSIQAIETNLEFSDLKISREELYSTLGYKEIQPDGDALSIINELLEEAAGICRPRFGYTIENGEVTGKQLRIGDITFTPDFIISKSLKGCTVFAVILATVGKELDEWIQRYRAGGDVMKAFVADGIGSVFAEAVVDFGKEMLSGIMKKDGQCITNLYSPGYCGWKLKEQQDLFRLFPEGFCGVTLTDSSLMLPLKSVSSVIGIGKNIKNKPYGCDICGKLDCYRRKNKSNRSLAI